MDNLVGIGEAAEWVGLAKKTIRYYEEIGLVTPLRAENGYRQFRHNDIRSLQVVKRARELGFSIEDSRTLLTLYQAQDRSSAEVKAVAAKQLEISQQKIAQLKRLCRQLEHLTSQCQGNNDPDCAILDFLADIH